MDNKTKWHLAAKYGLKLALVTIVIGIVQAYLNKPIIGSLLSIVKLILTISLLRNFMQKFTDLQPNRPISYGQSFRFGFLVSFFSSIVCVAFFVLEYTVFFPHLIDAPLEQYATMMKQYGTTIPLDYDQLRGLLPSIIMIGQTFNCLIWGLILSSIIANWTKKDMPFFDKNDNNFDNNNSNIDSEEIE
ncbi:MAG: DUF4199 domain-containing protein [Bacteroidales bacterium]